MSERKCKCMAWEDQIDRINAPIILSQLRAGQAYPEDRFIPWNYCPWCGSALLSVTGRGSGETG